MVNTPTPSISAEPAFDPRAFRSALGQYATGVAIVTALDETGRPVGMTINSLASVSLDPPLVLWSVQLNTTSSQAFRTCKRFSVNILAADQQDTAMRFARTDEHKFLDFPVDTGLGGVPLIPGALATFECATWAVYPGGDHEIIVGQVENFVARPGAALGFHQGKFLTLEPPLS